MTSFWADNPADRFDVPLTKQEDAAALRSMMRVEHLVTKSRSQASISKKKFLLVSGERDSEKRAVLVRVRVLASRCITPGAIRSVDDRSERTLAGQSCNRLWVSDIFSGRGRAAQGEP